MKRILYTFALFAAVMVCFAQAPQKFSYQSVVRDADGNLVKNSTIGMRIGILQGSASGPVTYQEVQTPVSNNVGLVTIQIGNGVVSVGSVAFDDIDWGNGPYYLKVETDIAGGTNYTIAGTSQLLSVPYALYAKKAGGFEITGNEVAFNNWDKNMSDDFSGNYADLTNAPDLSDTAKYLTKEVDPVFSASVAAGITATDTSNWNNGLPVGQEGNLITHDGNNWVAADLMLLDTLTGTTGNGTSFTNIQPYLGVYHIIALQGTFPSRSSLNPFLCEIIMFAGNFAPRGWAFCDGQLLPVSQNQAVFSLMGTAFGGDGRTTFRLPDLRSRVAIHPGTGLGLSQYRWGQSGGVENTTLTVPNLPSHNHSVKVTRISYE